MRAANAIVAVLLIGLGGVVMLDALRLGIGWAAEGPKSGFFPFWLALLLVATSAVLLAQAWRTAPGGPFVTRAQARPVLAVLIPATAAVVLMHFVGLYVAAALYLASYMRFIGRHAWFVVVTVAVLVPVAAFLVFEVWFLVPMPKGPLEAWLGY